MQWPLTVHRRSIERSDIDWIKQTMCSNPQMGRTALSIKLCERWNWRRIDGQLKDIACRELLRKLEKLDLLQLPKRQRGDSPKNVPKIRNVSVDSKPIKNLVHYTWLMLRQQQIKAIVSITYSKSITILVIPDPLVRI